MLSLKRKRKSGRRLVQVLLEYGVPKIAAVASHDLLGRCLLIKILLYSSTLGKEYVYAPEINGAVCNHLPTLPGFPAIE